jgi:hypothetical protein
MATCGIWFTSRSLVAVVLDDDGDEAASTYKAARTDHARWGLIASVEAHHGLDCVFVVSEKLLVADGLPRLALHRGSAVVAAPDGVLVSARRLAGLARASPRSLARLLARLPLCAPFAARLTRLEAQLPLFRA